MNEIFDENVVNEFLSESLDHLESIEPDFLALEEQGADASPETINGIFRAIHSIKGSSGFLGFKSLSTIAHAMENILMKYRNKEMVPDHDAIDALFEGIDIVRTMLNDITASNSLPIDFELDKLNKILNEDAEPATPSEENPLPQKEAAEPDMPPQKSTSSEKMTISEKVSLTLEEETLNEVVLEGQKSLEAIEMDLVSLKHEGTEVSHDSIANIFRAIHTRKGVTSFFGFDELALLSFSLEDIIADIKDGKKEAVPESVDALLSGIDEIRAMLKKIKSNQHENLTHANSADTPDEKQLPVPHASQAATQENANKKSPPPPVPAQPQASATKSLQPSSGAAAAKPAMPETIRVNVNLIDRLMNLAGELVLGRNQLRQELAEIVFKNPKLGTVMQNVDSVTSEIQEEIMQMRMQAVGTLFNKFPRVVRDLSRQLNKKVKLLIEGNEVEIDKTILEGLSDPLTHLVRNSMDHGLELPADRLKINKPESGQVQIRAFHEGGQVNIMVLDDGNGIDPEKLVAKAISIGAITPEKAANLNDSEKINLILLPGFSTADKITGVSGRGVGMDVVKTNIEKMGGNLEIESMMGEGTYIRIRLPLTLAIIPSLIVGASLRKYAIPQVNVQELVRVKAMDVESRIEKIGDSLVLRLRERLLPLVSLSAILDLQDSSRKVFSILSNNDTDDEPVAKKIQDINVVVLKMGGNSFGLIVDELFDNEEIVVKPLSAHISDTKCFSGATIMGDGKVAMILDASGIADFAKLKFTEIQTEEKRRLEEEAQMESDAMNRRQSLLIFNNAYTEFFALPLKYISRLEKIEPTDIHRVGSRHYINYRDQELPLIYLENVLPVSSFPKNPLELYVIIPKNSDTLGGIMVSRILDTVETEVNVHKTDATPKGLHGSSFVGDQLTLFLNPYEVLDLFEKQSLQSKLPMPDIAAMSQHGEVSPEKIIRMGDDEH